MKFKGEQLILGGLCVVEKSFVIIFGAELRVGNTAERTHLRVFFGEYDNLCVKAGLIVKVLSCSKCGAAVDKTNILRQHTRSSRCQSMVVRNNDDINKISDSMAKKISAMLAEEKRRKAKAKGGKVS